jgi:Pyridoxamine 5'-phosphate oxidase
MGKLYDHIDDKLAAWIRRQRLFFVATAPGDGGHVNVSPKGPIESLRIVDGRTVEYEDHVGSGAETVAHLRDNGRICVMLCAFDGPPRIVRLHGRGEVLPAGDVSAGVRGAIRVHVDRISDSCGYGVPLMEFVGERPQRAAWLAKKGPDGLREYVREKNAASIDGLPAVDQELGCRGWTSSSPTSSA